MSARWYIDRKCEVSIENHCRASTVRKCQMEDREKRIVRSPDQESDPNDWMRVAFS